VDFRIQAMGSQVGGYRVNAGTQVFFNGINTGGIL
jgi:hypothetical protein